MMATTHCEPRMADETRCLSILSKIQTFSGQIRSKNIYDQSGNCCKLTMVECKHVTLQAVVHNLAETLAYISIINFIIWLKIKITKNSNKKQTPTSSKQSNKPKVYFDPKHSVRVEPGSLKASGFNETIQRLWCNFYISSTVQNQYAGLVRSSARNLSFIIYA